MNSQFLNYCIIREMDQRTLIINILYCSILVTLGAA
jgi:hypothetical protein